MGIGTFTHCFGVYSQLNGASFSQSLTFLFAFYLYGHKGPLFSFASYLYSHKGPLVSARTCMNFTQHRYANYIQLYIVLSSSMCIIFRLLSQNMVLCNDFYKCLAIFITHLSIYWARVFIHGYRCPLTVFSIQSTDCHIRLHAKEFKFFTIALCINVVQAFRDSVQGRGRGDQCQGISIHTIYLYNKSSYTIRPS